MYCICLKTHLDTSIIGSCVELLILHCDHLYSLRVHLLPPRLTPVLNVVHDNLAAVEAADDAVLVTLSTHCSPFLSGSRCKKLYSLNQRGQFFFFSYWSIYNCLVSYWQN